MVISYQWLLEYLPEAVSVEELAVILTSIGLEVEAIEPFESVKGSLEGLLIGEVLTCEKHPNADKLSVTTVNVGSGNILNIVCGAPNVAAGQRVVVATVGTTVHPTNGEAFLIKKAKIRSIDSEGMICAEDEIGLSNSHAGIMILPENAPIGTLAKTYFNIPNADIVIHIGLTPNRTDAMSHIGVARDVCAYLTHHKGKPHSVRQPNATMPPKGQKALPIKVNIDATEACPRYTGVSMAGVKIGASPEWLQQCIKAIGLRPINNVVDITNFVLHEYGQPLHAFDADKIQGNVVNVRMLPQDTSFTTLDDKQVKLNSNDLIICDEANGMCIAGVFGGKNSGVTDSTVNIFLESAYFTPLYIRRTSMFHGLRTDAATHFEKGVDINNVLPALKRSATLITEIAGGRVASDIIDVTAQALVPVSIQVRYDYIQKLSGKAYSPATVKSILTALDFKIEKEDAETLTVTVPSNKMDVLQPADIVEEILRIDGLDNVTIPDKLNITLNKALPNDRAMREKVANLLVGAGFQEIVTNSIVNSKYYPERTDLVRMLNSLSNELDVLRPSMLESGLEVLQYNYNRKNKNISVFEFGKTYQTIEGKYHEAHQLALYVTGDIQSAQWNQKIVSASIFYLKGVIQNLLLQSGIYKTTLHYEETDGGMLTVWKWKNINLCTAMRVNDTQTQMFEIKQEVYYATIDWTLWTDAMTESKIKYREVPRFPAVERDLAIILDKAVPYKKVQEVTEQLKINSLQTFNLFDVFENEKLGQDKKSYALSYIFQLQDRTLTDSEIEQTMNQLISAYKSKLQANIRE